MIRDFKGDQTELIWQGVYAKRLPTEIQNTARRKLRMLNNVRTLADLRVPPANRLEALKGKRRGQSSIRINDQWRSCFRWKDGDVFAVEIVDYHKG